MKIRKLFIRTALGFLIMLSTISAVNAAEHTLEDSVLQINPALIKEPIIFQPIDPIIEEPIVPEDPTPEEPIVSEEPVTEPEVVKDPIKTQIENTIRDIRDDQRAGSKNNQPKANPLEKFGRFFMENLGVIFTVIAVLVAISGFTFAGQKKKRSISKYLHSIDDTYAEYKMKAKRCEAELYRLKDIIDEELKTGKLDDSAYALLISRIEGYMIDIQKQIVNEKFGGLPGTLKNELFRMMEDGEITDQEMDTFQKLIGRSEDISSTDKDSLLAQVRDFKIQDEKLKKRR